MRTYEIETRSLEEATTAATFTTARVEDLQSWIPKALEKVAMHLGRLGMGPFGMPYVRYHPVGDGKFEVEAGFPASGIIPPGDDVRPSSLPGGLVAVLIYLGPYETMEPAYEALFQWLAAEGKTPNGDMWEVYFTDPDQEPNPENWRTEIFQPYS